MSNSKPEFGNLKEPKTLYDTLISDSQTAQVAKPLGRQNV